MKEVLMTEAGMAPERQGWFAGVKAKVAEKLKRFTVSGAKEEFYKKNAPLIERATANLTPDDKQKAFAMIEQDALASAKVDVAMHWGAAVVGTTAVVLGGNLVFNEKFRGKVGGMGGRLGQGLESFGLKGRKLFDRIFRRGERVVRTGAFDAQQASMKGMRENIQNIMRKRNAGEAYRGSHGSWNGELAHARAQLDKAAHAVHEPGKFVQKIDYKAVRRNATIAAQRAEYAKLKLEERVLEAGANMKNVADPDRLKAVKAQLKNLDQAFKARKIGPVDTLKVPVRGSGRPAGAVRSRFTDFISRSNDALQVELQSRGAELKRKIDSGMFKGGALENMQNELDDITKKLQRP